MDTDSWSSVSSLDYYSALKPQSLCSYTTSASSSSHSVQVAVRCRPVTEVEAESPLEFQEKCILVQTDRSYSKRKFDIDYVFEPFETQEEVYRKAVHELVHDVLNGSSGTILAYGQTGTGKTYTMGLLEPYVEEEAGIIPRVLEQIFASHKNRVKMSFLQIYLETVQDLLVPPFKVWCNDLNVRQSASNEFYVEGLSEYEVTSVQDAHALVGIAMRNRVLASTTRNLTSSRSHTIFKIHILPSNTNQNELGSTLTLVDLAGSERVLPLIIPKSSISPDLRKKMETQMKEAKFINTSLCALGNVICTLSNPKSNSNNKKSKKTNHVQYRESKLTKLLKGYLGGQVQTLIIATIDNSILNLSETLSTLKFATRCKLVDLTARNKLPLTSVNRNEEEEKLKHEIILLKKQFQESENEYQTKEIQLHIYYQSQIQTLEQQKYQATMELKEQLHDQKYKLKFMYTILYNLVQHIVPLDTVQSSFDQIVFMESFSTSVDKFKSFMTSAYESILQTLGSKVCLEELVDVDDMYCESDLLEQMSVSTEGSEEYSQIQL